MLRKLPVSILTGIAALGLVACTQASVVPSRHVDKGQLTSISTEHPKTRTIGFARWPTAEGRSLKDLAGSYATIVVGTVTVSTDLTAPGSLGPTQAMPPFAHDPVDKAKEGMQPKPYVPGEDPPSLTGYSVTVTTVIKGTGIRVGDTVNVHQSGGMLKGIAFQLEDNPVIQIGTTYLFFLNNADGSALAGPPYGRFQIGKDTRLTPVDPAWESMSAVKEMSTLSLDEAVRKISAVISSS